MFPPPRAKKPPRMVGSGPPLSQEVLYAREALQEVNRTLARLYLQAHRVPGANVDLLEVMRAIVRCEEELTGLSGRARAAGQ